MASSVDVNKYDGFLLGYYPLRGKMQVCRILCQYLHLKYIDLLFTPQTWEQFKATQNLKWNYQQLPFLKDKEVVVTQAYPICLYILHKAGQHDLLGKTIEDQAKVDMFVWENEVMCQILSILISFKNKPVERKMQVFHKYWEETLRAKFIKLQQFVTETFYLPYLTIVDFFIYDIIYVFKQIVPLYLAVFPKLCRIYESIAEIPEIKAYESSTKAIKQICPAEYCKIWKQKCVKSNQGFSCS